MLMLLVAESRGMLADGVRLRGEDGEFLGRYDEVSWFAWFDGLRCGPKEMSQLVLILADSSGTLLASNYSFPVRRQCHGQCVSFSNASICPLI